MKDSKVIKSIELSLSQIRDKNFQEKRRVMHTYLEYEKELEAYQRPDDEYILHSSVLKNDKEAVIMLLKNGADANLVDRLGRTPLHCAAITSSNSILEILIENGANANAKIGNVIKNLEGEMPYLTALRNINRTALHIANARLDYECVRILLQKGANVNCTDSNGLTPLLVCGESKNRTLRNSKERYENIVRLLLEWKANVKVIDAKTKTGPLHQALNFDCLNAFRDILMHGADPFMRDNNGDTILHTVCKRDKESFANELLMRYPSLVHVKNFKAETPLHCAAFVGSRTCLALLINSGGDLSETNTFNLTVSDIIVSNVPRPLNFLVETLDSKLIPNEYSINDQNFTVTLDFEVLIPTGGQQTSVLIALINSLPNDQKSKIVLHPLVSTFIRLKWVKLRILFFLLVIIHFMFVMSLSLHICFLIKGQSMSVYNWSRFILLFTSAVILLHILTQISLASRYFLKEFETWLSLACVSLSLTIGIWETFFIDTPLPPDWIRHLAAYDILLSWILLMFILGRFPLMGYFALMFFKVLKNVVKVLLFFTCLVIGFSLSFCVQFNDMQFDDPWKAFVRTTIMLMGEYEYAELFNDQKLMKRFQEVSGSLFVTSRIIFLLFVLLGSIVLVNLMTGLAVNDIQSLRAEGCLRHMIKQAEFISHVEKVSRKHLNQRFISNRLIKMFNKWQNLPRMITLRPNIGGRTCEVNNNKKINGISLKLMESITLCAIKNQKKNLKNLSENIIVKDGFDVYRNNRNQWLDNHINDALNEIKEELNLLSMQLLQYQNGGQNGGMQL